jgi:excisionase family DNA binding protein
MQLTVRQAATRLGVDETTVRRWVTQRGLPVHHANERIYINAVELWEWAVENGIPVSRQLLDVGPVARCCDVRRDVRHDHPYGVFRFAQIPVGRRRVWRAAMLLPQYTIQEYSF